jgi:hypothetical protein
MAVGGEPDRFLKRIHETWVTWRGHFTPVIRHNTAMVRRTELGSQDVLLRGGMS